MQHKVLDAPRHEKAVRRTNKKAQREVSRRLYEHLISQGFMTALPSVRASRMLGYLAKPAKLLHDGWHLDGACDSGLVTYFIGSSEANGQVLRIDRKGKRLQLDTFCRTLGQTQTIVYSVKEDKVLQNSLWTDFDRVKSHEDLCKI